MLEYLLGSFFGPVTEELKQIRRLLALLVLPVPGPVRQQTIAEGADGMLVYKAAFPPKPTSPADVVTQHLKVSVGETVIHERDYTMDETSSDEFSVNDNDHVSMALNYVDDAGNIGAATTQEFDAHDTIPPDAPGPFGEVTLVREE